MKNDFKLKFINSNLDYSQIKTNPKSEKNNATEFIKKGNLEDDSLYLKNK